jgi:hypothetical protein
MTAANSLRSPHCQDFFTLYNHEHRHSGLGLHTAADVHHGQATAVQGRRASVLTDAYLARPERFVRQRPQPPRLPSLSWFNPPEKDGDHRSVIAAHRRLIQVDKFRRDLIARHRHASEDPGHEPGLRGWLTWT